MLSSLQNTLYWYGTSFVGFVLPQLLVILPITYGVARLMKWKRVDQPEPVGWILAGLIMGPSLFGLLAPSAFNWIFTPLHVNGKPSGIEPSLALQNWNLGLNELGLILLLLLEGAKFNFSHLNPWKSQLERRSLVGTVLISIFGIVCPATLAWGTAPWVYELSKPHIDQEIPFTDFRLFLCIAVSITALPILAKIMTEYRFERTRLGAVTITCAGMDDAIGWLGLAGITAAVKSEPQTLHVTFAWLVVYFIVMISIVRPRVCRLFTWVLKKHDSNLPWRWLAVLLILMSVSAYVTTLLKIFPIFGAFMMGALLSGIPGMSAALDKKLRTLTVRFVLPVFFASTGLRTSITSIEIDLVLLVLAIAIVGKLGGCYVAARVSRTFSHRESLCIGIMMNCRALMELVALNVGYELKVIPQSAYSALVIMAFLTTWMTLPFLRRCAKGTELEEYLCQEPHLRLFKPEREAA